jgi:RNA polymerase sigma-70 factor, ECF subfamily
VSSGEFVLQPIEGGHASLRPRSQRRVVRSEQRLISSARAGSAEALEELYRGSWPAAYRTAYLIVHDAAAAEDIAQEAFLGAIRSLDSFDRRRPFRPWLHRIVVNRAIDWTRARALRREVSDEPLAVLESSERPPLDDDLVAALGRLPVEHRAVIVLRYLFEYTPGEIAELLDLPRGTVNSRMRRALDSLGSEFA